MPFIDFSAGPEVSLRSGIHGVLHHSDQLSFGHITLEAGAVLPEHFHVHEQWTHIIEGELEFTLSGETRVMTLGMVAYMPSNAPHSARAITRCRVIDCFMPVREDYKSLEPWIPE